MRKCSVILPLSPGAEVSTSFISDLNEALTQMRGRQLHDVCIVFPAGNSSLLEPLRKLCEGSHPVHYQLGPEESVISCINKGFSHAIEKKCDAIVVIPGSIIAPETLSSLSTTGNSADNFGIVSARVYKNQNEASTVEQESLYLSFLEQSKDLFEWQETRSPSPFCCFFSFRLLREQPTIALNYEYLNEALYNYSQTSYSLGFRSLLHNKTFHAFPLSAGEELYHSPFLPNSTPNDSEHSTAPATPKGVIPDYTIKERLGAIKRSSSDSRPSLVVDLRKLPPFASPLFELGIHIAAAAHSRLTWSTTLLVPSRKTSDVWKLQEKFPRAEIVTDTPQRCYDYSLYPTSPDTLGEIASFITLSPNPFFLLHEPFGRAHHKDPQSDALCRVITQFAQGILLVGNASTTRFRSNLLNRALPPLHSVLPSQYSKDYSRINSGVRDREGRSILICLPTSIPDYLAAGVQQILMKLRTIHSTILGEYSNQTDKCSVQPYEKLDYEEVNQILGSSVFVVIPILTEDLVLYLAKALSLGKIVITLESELVDEFKERWFGPRNLLTVPSFEELPSIIQSFTSESERTRIIAHSSTEKVAQNNCQRWTQIGASINEFLVTSSKRYPVTADEFITKQSLLSDLITSTFHLYSYELQEAENRIRDGKFYIEELEDRVKKLEAAQLLLATSNEPTKKSALQSALSALQEWGTRSK